MTTEHPQRELLPEMALVAWLLLLGGAAQVVFAPYQIWDSFQLRGIFVMLDSVPDWLQVTQSGLCGLASAVGMVAGIGLLRRFGWARRLAVLVLAGLALVELLPLVNFHGHDHQYLFPWVSPCQLPSETAPRDVPYLLRALGALFRAATPLLPLLALLTPAARAAWEDGWSAGRLDRWAERLSARVPAGLPRVAALLAGLFLCWGVALALQYHGQLFMAMAELQLTRTRLQLDMAPESAPVFSTLWVYVSLLCRGMGGSPLAFLRFFITWANLLAPLGYLLAGAGLLLRQKWARYLGAGVLVLTLLPQFTPLLGDLLDPHPFGASFWGLYLSLDMLQAVFALAYYTVLLNFLPRHHPAPPVS
ncbi:MAG: hypothetical protein ACYDBB_26665 [Armatimonadota bacterium]